MEIHFANKALRIPGKYAHIIKQLNRRLDQLASIDDLAQLEKDFPHLRCHEYSGADNETFTVDVSGNWRLLFRPTDEPEIKPDGGIDKNKVTAITIIDVIDPH